MTNDPRTRPLLTAAQRQHGVLLRQQILDAGFGDEWIQARHRAGWLRSIARGVYMVAGSPTSHWSRAAAATLTIAGSVASHELAAVLHGFSTVTAARPTVTVEPGRGAHSRLAKVHEYAGIGPEDIVVLRGIPTTTRALTVFHLSATQPVDVVDSTIEDLRRDRRVTLGELHALHDYWSRLGRPRRKVMTRLLLTRGDGYVATGSELERAFVNLVARFGLPEPTRQFRAPWLTEANGRVDFGFVAARLIVETDGRRWHTRQTQLDRDRIRDRAAALHGYQVVRYGFDEIVHRPAAVAHEVLALLATRSVA